MQNISLFVGKPDFNQTLPHTRATVINAMRGCYGFFLPRNPACHFTDEWHVATVYGMLKKKRYWVSHAGEVGGGPGECVSAHMEPRGTLVREAPCLAEEEGHHHRTQRLLLNLSTGSSLLSAKPMSSLDTWTPKCPRLHIWGCLWRSDRKWLFTFKSKGQCACLSPILSVQRLSKGQITLVMEKGSASEGCAAASQGLTWQPCLLDIWGIL